MAGRITLWGAGELLRTFFGQIADPPPNFYLALIREMAPTPYVSGVELDEPESDDYQRVAVPNDQLTWSNDGQIHIMSCETDIEFVQAQEDWGTVRYWALCNALVDGYVYFIGDFETPDVVFADETVIIDAGELTVSLGPFFLKEE